MKRHMSYNKAGETMVEVIVAFALLSIMLVIFSQGIAYASRIEIFAGRTREGADNAMKELQRQKANKENTDSIPFSIAGKEGYRQVYVITVDGESYTYVVYGTNATATGR